MQRMVDPRQTRLFDPYAPVLTATNRQWLEDNWPGVFRHVILELMPVDVLRQHFDPALGRPTQELYSMAGLILLLEFHHWTKEYAVEAYRFHLEVQYALNLEPQSHDLSVRTLERYLAYFVQDEVAQRVMQDVTTRLVTVLGLKIDQQRLDSTHVFSDMAHFGRTRLLGVALKRFLTQVQRHDPAAYAALPEVLRQRYAPSALRLFADTARDRESQSRLRQQVAEDLYQVLRLFAAPSAQAQRSSYQALARIFREQCEVQQEKVTLKTQAGSTVMQNPSDPDATYDGHKGPGYQVQLAETCHPDNETQLITCALPQTAAVTDEKALVPVLQDLQASQLLPEQLLVDTLYPSDENVQQAERLGVELVGPVPGAAPGRAAGRSEHRRLRRRRGHRGCDVLSGRTHAGAFGARSGDGQDPLHDARLRLCPLCLPESMPGRGGSRRLSSGAYGQAAADGGSPARTADGGLSHAVSPPQRD